MAYTRWELPKKEIVKHLTFSKTEGTQATIIVPMLNISVSRSKHEFSKSISLIYFNVSLENLVFHQDFLLECTCIFYHLSAWFLQCVTMHNVYSTIGVFDVYLSQLEKLNFEEIN